MMPGMTHSVERSRTVASFGIATLAPTSAIFLSFTRMIWFLATEPVAGSMRFPARMATVCAQAGTARNKQKMSRRFSIFSPFFFDESGVEPARAIIDIRTEELAGAHGRVDLSQSLQSISLSGLPVDVDRRLRVEYRHVDADRGARLVDLPAEPF